jgi:hypothetical protein
LKKPVRVSSLREQYGKEPGGQKGRPEEMLCRTEMRQKKSGGSRSEQGAVDFAVVRSLISTARKQGWDLLETLTANSAKLIESLRLA